MTYATDLIDRAKASLSDNSHKIRSVSLMLAVGTLEGRAQAVGEIAQNLRTAAEAVADALVSPFQELDGHGFNDQPYHKATTCMAIANLRSSIREVEREIERFEGAKAAHLATLRSWAEAA